MPLSALNKIKLDENYWCGWDSFLKTIPALDTQEGSVATWLNTLKPATFPKTFVPQSALPSGVSYEAFIFEQHQIPTRDGLHDFFNGLCWLSFPKTKLSFNHIHHQQMAQLGTTQRGKVRDMLTVIDENGFLIECPDELWQALSNKQWIKAFIDLRALWQQSRVMVFGHALLEKLVNPYKAITAHAIRIPTQLLDTKKETGFNQQDLQRIDTYLAEYLSEKTLVHKPYIPIQILGIPGWGNEEQNLAYYQDTSVFRTANVQYTESTLKTKT